MCRMLADSSCIPAPFSFSSLLVQSADHMHTCMLHFGNLIIPPSNPMTLHPNWGGIQSTHQPVQTEVLRGETNSAARLANGPTLTGTPQRQHEPVPLMPKQTRTSLSNSGGSNVGNAIAECLARNGKADCKANSQLDHTTPMSTLGIDDLRCETSGNDTTPPGQTWTVKSKHESEQKSRTRKRASAPKMDASTQNGGIAQMGD
jgi:hypothetical protein